jgi:hypothetical protein
LGATRSASRNLAIVAFFVGYQAILFLGAWTSFLIGALDNGVAFGAELAAATQTRVVNVKPSLNHGPSPIRQQAIEAVDIFGASDARKSTGAVISRLADTRIDS